ncbi:MAG: prolipoprotein diacylglyceryl transferase [Candidatus Omnitrophica bacterium]|nr:prolipoprotein diacylglyceryl transferase [Candidatus Omnitrophota bacterium]MCF7891380.1 prolipoprotein diacylglyceryl transferase [Candidatus Omnitrophota bacterium]MCF7897904.1 prolipoprotein diacylglyceryl transferase [Candidatus Omnitrophota bacterium]MCF7909035.1 prolipoprotein diacylglyceryl transferase [Candidatus Omnitrophota bacterium]
MHPILFKIGPVTIYTYGFFIFLGVLFGYLVSQKRAKESGIDKQQFSNIFFQTLIAGFIGARIVYIIINWQYFLNEPLNIIFSRSGFVFYGGIIFGILSVFILSKKHKINFLKITDIFALAIPLAHGFGRIGCFFYGCCYGLPAQSFLGIKFPPNSPAGSWGAKVIPTQIISAVFLFILFIFLFKIRNKAKSPGKLTGYYLLIYGVFRFIIEFFRGDPRGFFLIFSTSQWLSLLLIFLASIILNKKNRQK